MSRKKENGMEDEVLAVEASYFKDESHSLELFMWVHLSGGGRGGVLI